ncbi:fasciclin domain-containing protein [Filimonas effusa]|uniref:Fasciclin domain-containing protein n=1 Tax=Filimonas effusa TaxID=2508721 RepID=A0A4Q1DAB0_9BACT|nr:fasciclin domain-containing protein [Filimonas effusa]RXK86317.1 fasciclin domain-containing protein [Filimonas effusa]
MRPVKVIVLLLLCAGVSITGCKNDLNVPPGASVAQIIASDPNKDSLLYHALKRTGYLQFVSSSPNLTLFAPNNEAFVAAGYPTYAAIDAANLTDLTYIIGYHLAGRALAPNKIPANGQLQTLNNYIFTSNTAKGIFINGIALSTTYEAAANGVIYRLNKLLTPPAQTLQQIIDTDNNLSFFAKAVKTDTSLIIFSSLTSFNTALVPVNQAFKDAGLADEAAVAALGVDSLDKLIKYHIIEKQHLLTTDFINGTRYLNMRDSAIYTSVGTEATFLKAYPKGQSILIPFVKKDSIAINGVIHYIDQLLKP